MTEHTPAPWRKGPYGGIYPQANGPMIAHAETKSGKLPLWQENEAFIVRAVNAHAALIAALQECEDYFDNRADADCDQDGFIPNKEMRLLSEVRAALQVAGEKP